MRTGLGEPPKILVSAFNFLLPTTNGGVQALDFFCCQNSRIFSAKVETLYASNEYRYCENVDGRMVQMQNKFPPGKPGNSTVKVEP
jgi:hypothetical protein